MRAAYINRFDAEDPASCVTVGDMPAPEPRPGWAVVDVAAASLNQHDVFAARGVVSTAQQLPLILGMDAAGLDDEGRRVVVHTLFKSPDWSGDEPLDPNLSGLTEHGNHGAFAEQVLVPRRNLVLLPDEVSFEDAACLPTAWLTAYRMLFVKAQLRPGQTVLVQGAAGGVASACIALAASAGVRVWVTGRTPQKRDVATSIGADATFEIGARLPDRVDAVMDTVGEPTFAHSMRCVRPGGTVVVAGGTGGYVVPLRIDQCFIRNISIVGSTMGSLAELRRLVDYVAARRLRPRIAAVLPLDRAAEAIRRMASDEICGKLVIRP